MYSLGLGLRRPCDLLDFRTADKEMVRKILGLMYI